MKHRGKAAFAAAFAVLSMSYLWSAIAAHAQSDQRSNVSALWKGWHQCGASKVGTSAMISVDASGRLTGIREFYPTPSDAQRASGSFRVSGTYRSATGAVTLMAGDWINRPPGYGKCNLVGSVDTTGAIMTGTSPDCIPDCDKFELRRQ